MFTWDDEAEEYTAEFEDEDTDSDLLDGLREDADFRAFLPDGDETSWTVSGEALAALLRPAGDLALEFDTPDEDNTEQVMFTFFLDPYHAAGEIDGEVRCELAGEDDGIAEIALELDLDATRDVTDEFVELADDLGADGSMEGLDAIEVALVASGEGTLSWDLEAGRMAGLTVELDTEITFTAYGEQEFGDQSFEMELTLEMEGSTVISIEVEGR